MGGKSGAALIANGSKRLKCSAKWRAVVNTRSVLTSRCGASSKYGHHDPRVAATRRLARWVSTTPRCEGEYDRGTHGAPRDIARAVSRFRCAADGWRSQADQFVFDQQRQVQVLRRLRPVADHDVEVALRQRALVVELRRPAAAHPVAPAALPAKPPPQPARKDAAMKSGEPIRKVCWRQRGVELPVAGAHGIQLRQCAPGTLAQRQGPVGGWPCRPFRAPAAGRIDLAQAIERLADRRLCLVRGLIAVRETLRSVTRCTSTRSR